MNSESGMSSLIWYCLESAYSMLRKREQEQPGKDFFPAKLELLALKRICDLIGLDANQCFDLFDQSWSDVVARDVEICQADILSPRLQKALGDVGVRSLSQFAFMIVTQQENRISQLYDDTQNEDIIYEISDFLYMS